MLGVRLAALRKAAGMSQAYVAKELKISASAIGMYEQGRRQPSADILAAIRQLQKCIEYAQGNVSPAAICGYLQWTLRN